MLATVILLAGALIFTLPAPSAGGEIYNGTLSAGAAPGEIGVLDIDDTLVTGDAITLQVDTGKSDSADLISVSGEFKSDTNNKLIVIDLGSLNNVDSVALQPDLLEIIYAWQNLPDSMRKGIVAMVKAISSASE